MRRPFLYLPTVTICTQAEPLKGFQTSKMRVPLHLIFNQTDEFRRLTNRFMAVKIRLARRGRKKAANSTS